MPVNFVLGVEEVHVAGRDNGLSELVAQLYNRAVETSKLLLVLCHALLQHEAVVADGLNFQVIVKFRDALELGPALVIDNGLKELARLAGRADDEPLAPPEKLRLRHDGHALKILEVAVGNEAVEVPEANRIFGEHDDVLCPAVKNAAARAKLRHAGIHGAERMHALFVKHFPEAHHEIAAGDRVIGGPVVVEFRQAQSVGHDVQLVFPKVGHQVLRQNERIDIGRLEGDIQALTCGCHEADVKVRVVGAKRPVSHEAQKFRKNFLNRGRALQHLVGNARELNDLGKKLSARRDEGLEGIKHLIALHDCRADLDDRVVLRR